MSKRNDGGPAFPSEMTIDRETGERMPYQFGNDDFVEQGMSMRDYFAAKAHDMSEDTTVEHAEAILGKPRPDKISSDPEVILAWARFWIDANAVYKYMQADAMLAARESNHDQNRT